MQTIPASSILTPLSVQSSPSSSFFLDQTFDAAEKQSHKSHKLKDGPSLLGLNYGDDEGVNVSVDEERLLEKSYWSDDSDVDEDEDEGIYDQIDDEDIFGQSVTPAINLGAQDKEMDEQAFKVGGKEDMEAAIVLEETNDEMVELSGDTRAGDARGLNRDSGKAVPWPSIQQ